MAAKLRTQREWIVCFATLLDDVVSAAIKYGASDSPENFRAVCVAARKVMRHEFGHDGEAKAILAELLDVHQRSGSLP